MSNDSMKAIRNKQNEQSDRTSPKTGRHVNKMKEMKFNGAFAGKILIKKIISNNKLPSPNLELWIRRKWLAPPAHRHQQLKSCSVYPIPKIKSLKRVVTVPQHQRHKLRSNVANHTHISQTNGPAPTFLK